MTDPSPLTLPLEIVTRSEEETASLGERIAALLSPGHVVYLEGELGAGKTVLCRGVAVGLGVDRSSVRSPSFNILFTYRGRVPVHHIDLYRLEAEEEILDAGLEEAIWDPEAIVLIEWPGRLGRIRRPAGVEIVLQGSGDRPRTIEARRFPG